MRLLFLTLLAFFCSTCYAQEPQNVFFLKNDNSPVLKKDSADFVRVFTATDTGSTLFNVIDYYKNGKKKAIGKSSSPFFATYHGSRLTFFENGKRRSTENYDRGLLIGETQEYFPNGKLYARKDHTIKETLKDGLALPARYQGTLIIEAYDSLGVKQVSEGNGKLFVYDDNFSKITESGDIKDGKRDGEWTGTDDVNRATFKETYINGVLLSGTANYNGVTSVYSRKRFTDAQFPNGDRGFALFLAKNIRFPRDAAERHVSGSVVVMFNILVNGDISNTSVFLPVHSSLDTEALRTIKSSPQWLPASKYGQPVNSRLFFPITFNMAN